jgi:competence protein ComEA
MAGWVRFVIGLVLSVAACAVCAEAKVDVNTAKLAQLEALGGLGTTLAARIVEERQQRLFSYWADLRHRVKGLGPKVAARLSGEGLTVNGESLQRESPAR